VFVALEGGSMGQRPIFAVIAIVLLAIVGPWVPATATPISQWVRPVAGGIVRPFDPPASRFGAGHLGVDLAAPAGTSVHAAGPGVVAFAGSVAGALHVVVAHAGNLRTSYSFLATIGVRRGERVASDDAVGTSGGVGMGHDGSVLHFGLRSGDTYIDPMLLLRPVDLATVVHLVPTTLPPRPASGSNERRGLIAGLVHGVGVVVYAAGTAFAATGHVAGAALADGRDALTAAESGIRRFAESRFPLQAAVARGVATWLSERGHCDSHAPAADGTGGSDHRVMIVAGLDSSITDGGPSSPLPPDKLGYEAGEVTYFSYARGGGDYTPADTEGSLITAARRLGAQLRALERLEPGREVDLLGHSQGGVIVTEFLTHVYDAGDPSYPPLGTVVALSSPFGGTPAATAVTGAARTRAGRAAMDTGRAVADRLEVSLPDPQSASARDLAEHSDFTDHLGASKLPDQVQLTAIGAATDFLVPAPFASRRDARNTVVIPHGLNAHTAIVADPSALMATRAAIEQRPLPCRSLMSTLEAEVLSAGIVSGERAAGTAVSLAVGDGS
jgi:hypothetical protein